mmetsp:Transcript_20776/g.35571  ORF Transcript_20776/g.35571 Transcript_20776/m.35571 type:complete len:505 (+) Transcript_20776:70-1584(+)
METLPSDVLPSVLAMVVGYEDSAPKQVCAAAQVGRAWRSAAGDPTLWLCLSKRLLGTGGGKLDFQCRAWTLANWQSDLPVTRMRCMRGAKHPGMVCVVAHDGGLSASGGNYGEIKLWKEGALLATLLGHAGAVSALLVDAASGRVYSGGWDKSVRTWDVATGECVCEWHGRHGRAVTCLQLLGDHVLVSGGGDGRVVFSSLQSDAHVRSVREDWPVLALSAAGGDGHADGGGRAAVTAAYADGSVRRWVCDLDESGSLIGTELELEDVHEEPSPLAPVREGPLLRQPATVAAALRCGDVILASRDQLTSYARLAPVPAETPGPGGKVPDASVSVGAPASAGWAWETAAKRTITAVAADERRVVVVGSRAQARPSSSATPNESCGTVTVLDGAGGERHSLEVASPVMSVCMRDDVLLLGCRDGQLRLVDYSVRHAPRPSERSGGSLLWLSGCRLVRSAARRSWSALSRHAMLRHTTVVLIASCVAACLLVLAPGTAAPDGDAGRH